VGEYVWVVACELIATKSWERDTMVESFIKGSFPLPKIPSKKGNSTRIYTPRKQRMNEWHLEKKTKNKRRRSSSGVLAKTKESVSHCTLKAGPLWRRCPRALLFVAYFAYFLCLCYLMLGCVVCVFELN
jgi:hypothetical protein